MLEMVAITFPGAHGAERKLSELRATRDEPWLGEISVIERDQSGRYAVKAKNPSLDEDHVGAGAAIGGLTGLFVGLVGGPLGLLLWGSLGALTGAAIGASRDSAFKPMVAELEARMAMDSSTLVLVGESPTLDALTEAAGAGPGQVYRQMLTDDQAEELARAHEKHLKHARRAGSAS